MSRDGRSHEQMNDDGDFRAVIGRLRALGMAPVDPSVARAHLEMMAAVTPAVSLSHRVRSSFSGKLRAGAAIVAISVAGGTGLAFAGALPGAVQNAAHDAFDKV